MKKKILSAILCMAMLLGVIANPLAAYAADTDNYLSVAQYRSEDGNHTAPVAPEGKVFAGWYKDAECTKPWGTSITEEKAYAKFVNKAVLSVKWQMLAGTASDSKITDIRFVTTVDSLNYKEVGFVITVGNKSTAPQMTNVVYEKIAGWVDGNQNYYQPTVFDETSKYFMAWELWNIPNESFAKDITVDAVWTTLDGTTVYGNNVDANVAENLVEPNFDEGVTFEYPSHANVTKSASLVKYEDTSIGAQSEAYGTYGMKQNATNSVWPHMVINFGKTYPVGSMFNCKMYVEVDPEVVAELGDNAYFWTDSWVAEQQSATAKISKFNEWVDVSFALRSDSASSIDFFLNFDNGSSASKFGDTPVTVYMDNVQVTGWDYSEGITFENSVETKALSSSGATLTATDYSALSLTDEEKALYGENAMKFEVKGHWPSFIMNLEKAYPAGSKIGFSIYAKADEAAVADQIFWVDNDDATKHPFNQWTVGYATIKEESTTKSLFLNFESARTNTSNTPITVYIDNFFISEGDFEEGMTFENEADKFWFSKNNVAYTLEEFDGTKALKMDATNVKYPYINVNFGKTLTSANLRLSFKIYVQVDETLAKDQIFYVGNDDGTKHPVNQWTEGFVKIATDSTSKAPFLNLNALITAVGSTTPITVYLDEFHITEALSEETITFDTNLAEKYIFWGGTGGRSFVEKSGSTVLKVDATGKKTSSFWMGYKQAYNPAQTIYFKIYVEADKTLVAGQTFTIGGAGAYPYNKWVEGQITTGTNASREIYWTFNEIIKDADGNNAKVTVYLDDFEVR